jgi:riboflavin kinase/FMN adenylyltransferase
VTAVHRWRSLADVPDDLGASVAAIGVFDGVHRGHRAAVARTLAAARERAAAAVVVTFDPHPMAVVRPEALPPLLGTVDERLDLLAGLGVDGALVLPFDREMSSWSPEEFVDRVLVDTLHVRRVVVGENFRFGHRAAGDVALLSALGPGRGFDVDPVALVAAAGEPVSSTLVRGLVAAGDVAAAARALDRPYRVSGPVVRGDARGRDLGYPTANVAVAGGIAVPADGVYAGWLVRADGSRWPAAVSIGTNPTFDGTERRVEAYLLDADVDLYGEQVAVEFGERVRDMRRFDTVDELLAQMAQDVADVRRIARISDISPGAQLSDSGA